MKLFLISQNTNNNYDTFDSAVVCVPDEETARHCNPQNGEKMRASDWRSNYWCKSPLEVNVKYLGEAAKDITDTLILASYNAA